MRFKKRSHPHNVKVQGEAARVDVQAVAGYPSDLAQIIIEGVYTKQKVGFQRRLNKLLLEEAVI